MNPASLKDNLTSDNNGHWPRTGLEAYARWRGTYTIEKASKLLE
jgi:hypothetical protein